MDFCCGTGYTSCYPGLEPEIQSFGPMSQIEIGGILPYFYLFACLF